MMNASQTKKMEESSKNPKSDQANADPSEGERIYGIDGLNLGEPVHDSEIDSEWLLAQRRESQMEDK